MTQRAAPYLKKFGIQVRRAHGRVRCADEPGPFDHEVAPTRRCGASSSRASCRFGHAEGMDALVTKALRWEHHERLTVEYLMQRSASIGGNDWQAQ
jgi:hypothetical protein